MRIKCIHLPSTIAKVLVALRSLFAELFSRFFLLALLVLYIVNLELLDGSLRSFLDDEELVKPLELRPNWIGRRDFVLLSLRSSCLFELLPFFFVCNTPQLLPPRGGGDDDVDDEGPDVALVFGLGLSCRRVLFIVPSYVPSLLFSILLDNWAWATAL